MKLRVRTSESQGVTVARTLDLPDLFAVGADHEQAMASLLERVEERFTERNAAGRRSRRHVLDLDGGRWRCVLCRAEFEEPPEDAACGDV